MGGVPRKHDTIFYDGQCGLCHALVRFVAARDPAARFEFAPLGGELHARLLPASPPGAPADSVLVLTRAGVVLARSPAVLLVLGSLPRPWPAAATALAWLPAPLLNSAYALLARLRRRLFPAPGGPCPLVPPALRSRFHL
jgi:predicted DCC family thiol-disulfide oxidoreductase YuxK